VLRPSAFELGNNDEVLSQVMDRLVLLREIKCCRPYRSWRAVAYRWLMMCRMSSPQRVI
jgi:hypothetical protein